MLFILGHAVHFAKCCDFPRSSPIEFGQSFFIVSIRFGAPKFVQMVIGFDMGVSENSVPLNSMVNDPYPLGILTQHFQVQTHITS